MSNETKQLTLLDLGPTSSQPEPQPYPEWYTPSSERRSASRSVLRGRHPMGFELATGRDTCSTCAHLVRKSVYLKCAMTKMTSGAATDIRAKWPACVKWEELR